MKLDNLKIFGEDGRFHNGSITTDGDRFGCIELGDAIDLGLDDLQSGEHLQCDELLALPGFVDIHFHGAGGVDFCDATVDTLATIARYEAQHGVLAICPATMTYPEERLMPVMKTAAEFAQRQAQCDDAESRAETGADLIGINMEGPFVSPDKVGGQNPDFVQAPNSEMLQRLDEASGGLVKLVDVAPEVDGCLDFICSVSADYRVSIAHTCATYEEAQAAIEAGAAHMTHTYNAMPGLTHRAAGPIAAAAEAAQTQAAIAEAAHDGTAVAAQTAAEAAQAQAATAEAAHTIEATRTQVKPQFHAEIITDGHHVSAPAIRLAFKIFGARAMCIISDSCEATGMPEGVYHLGGQNIIKRDGLAYLESDPTTIAASSTNQYDCFKYAVQEAGIPLQEAVAACTINPATAINQQANYGSIASGKYANLLIVDKNLEIKKIIQHGSEISVA